MGVPHEFKDRKEAAADLQARVDAKIDHLRQEYLLAARSIQSRLDLQPNRMPAHMRKMTMREIINGEGRTSNGNAS